MSISLRISRNLWSQVQVRSAFAEAALGVARAQLAPSVDFALEEEWSEPQWHILLTWASVLASSGDDDLVAEALVVAVAALEATNPDARIAAVRLLEESSNHPTADLARERLNLAPSNARVLGVLASHRRRLAHFILSSQRETALPCSPFQEHLFTELQNRLSVSISAPTSAGKSFVLEKWVVDFMADHYDAIVAYVVPSRALVRQVQNGLKRALSPELGPRFRVFTLPSLVKIEKGIRAVLVMTQERLDRVQTDPKFSLKISALVIDEAHQLVEGPRGIVLRRVRRRAIRENSACKVIMAGPHIANPEALLPSGHGGRDSSVVKATSPSVVQNLFWVNQVPRRPKQWRVDAIVGEEPKKVGTLRLRSHPGTTIPGILANIAVAIGAESTGNIIFSNGPAESEKIALMARELLESRGELSQTTGELAELAELIRTHVHPNFPLAETAPYGVGIHYGDMPEIARRAVEDLFDRGVLRYLVCTPTLMAGVNLPCRNLIVRGPRVGKSRSMPEHSFWNLAGRAGRWGREFAGNVFAVDTAKGGVWKDGVPRKRVALNIDPPGSEILLKMHEFQTFARRTDASVASSESRLFESAIAELVSTYASAGSLVDVGWLRRATADEQRTVDELVEQMLSRIDVPSILLERHAQIHPVMVSDLIVYLRAQPPQNAEDWMPMAPSDTDAVTVLVENLLACDRFLGSNFGNRSQCRLKADHAIAWMRGTPLAQIIKKRLDYLRGRKSFKVASEIRGVMRLINEEARFQIPKYLGCYMDCVRLWYQELGRIDLLSELSEVQDYLETGTSGRPALALVSLGLSRTAAVEIAQFIPNEGWGLDEVVEWLRTRDLDTYDISPIIQREVEQALESTV